MATDLGQRHFLWAGTLIMVFQMKFKVQIIQKKFKQFTVWFTQNLCCFKTGLLCFSSKSLYPESITAAMFTLPKN